MEKEYMFECRGCEKPDKTYWYNDEGKPEADGELYLSDECRAQTDINIEKMLKEVDNNLQ